MREGEIRKLKCFMLCCGDFETDKIFVKRDTILYGPHLLTYIIHVHTSHRYMSDLNIGVCRC